MFGFQISLWLHVFPFGAIVHRFGTDDHSFTRTAFSIIAYVIKNANLVWVLSIVCHTKESGSPL